MPTSICARKKLARKRENANTSQGKHDMENVPTTIGSSNDPKQNEFKCDICGNRLKTRDTLRKHKRIHLKPKDSAAANYRRSLADDKSLYQFKCDECGSRLKTRKNLIRHKKIHLKALGIQKEKVTKIEKEKNECKYCQKGNHLYSYTFLKLIPKILFSAFYKTIF